MPKYRTVLYRYGGDLLHALSASLWQQYTNQDGIKKQVKEVCTQLNLKGHTQAKKLIETDSNSPHKTEDFIIDDFINNIDKDLWEAICILTQPADTTNITHSRKIRRVFILRVILYTINSECSFPIHTLLVDIVVTCGGSTRVHKLLKRLGVCSSIETPARYVQHRVETRIKEGPLSKYPDDSFMIVSPDNLDYIHKYAQSFSGKQNISWHGTTLQIVQPKPKSLTDPHCIPLH